MPTIIESIQEFIERQGEYVRDGHRLIFANGAVLTDSGARYEPPTDEFTVLSLRAEFMKAKLGREENNFNSLKKYITTQAGWHARGAGPSPEPEAIEELKRLRGVIHTLRKEAESAELAVRRHQQSINRAGRDVTRAIAAREAADILSEVSGIEI